MPTARDKSAKVVRSAAKLNARLAVGDPVAYYSAHNAQCQTRAGTGVVCAISEWGIELVPDYPGPGDDRLWVPDASWLWLPSGENAAPTVSKKPVPAAGVWSSWAA